MKRSLMILAALAMMAACAPKGGHAPAIKPDKDIEAAVAKTLKGMTLEEKVGQLVEITLDPLWDFKNDCIDEEGLELIIGKYKVGSILNVPSHALPKEKFAQIVARIQEKSMEAIGIPCVYGLDMIHGATYYTDATFFPQEINLASSFDPQHARAMGEAIGYETRAGNVAWVYSPVMDLTRNPLWPRNWESWGEDPYLQSVMAEAETRAIQGDDPNHIDKHHCAVSLKHYMGYGNPVTGKDRTPAIITEYDLRDKYFRPFKACIEAGALTIMVNSASINGIPMHANHKFLTEWLKEGLNWDGMIVTDWADVNNLYTREHIAKDKKEALKLAINAGIDMIMEPYAVDACDLLIELAKEGGIPMSRIDDAAARVIRLKYRLGLFDEPTWDVSDEAYPEYYGERFINASRLAAVESQVLLKNNGILPLRKGVKILLTGPNADAMRPLNGGWSYTWQGNHIEAYTEQYNTIREAFENKFGKANVKCVKGLEWVEGKHSREWKDEKNVDIAAAVRAAAGVDVIVACIGENSYCETPGNTTTLDLSENQVKLVKALAATGKPVVLVLNEGRPRIVREIEPLASAVIDGMLPSNYGADALAELVSGDANFSAKLPFTYPKHSGSLHTYDYKISEVQKTMEGAYNYDAVMDVQWSFGSGLSYTTYEYSNLRVNKTDFKAGDVLEVIVNVKNTGKVAGREPVLLFCSDLVASMVPDNRRLRAFDKVTLAPGEAKDVTLKVKAEDLAFVNHNDQWVLEEGEFRFVVEDQAVIVNCTETKIW